MLVELWDLVLPTGKMSGPNPKVLPTVSYEILIYSCWVFPMMENGAGDGAKVKQVVPISSTATR